MADGEILEILEKFTIVAPAKLPTKKSRKGIVRVNLDKSISPRVKPTEK